MKKALLIIVSLLTASFVQLSAQNVLSLSNPKTGETNDFRKGSYVVYGIKADKSVHEGFIRSITDSSLEFDNAQVSLSQIDVLAGSTRERIRAQRTAQTIGAVLIAGAITALCIASSSSFHSRNYYHPEFHAQVWINLGYVVDWNFCSLNRYVHPHDYSEWNSSIVKEKVQAQKDISYDEKPVKEKGKKNLSGDDVYGD